DEEEVFLALRELKEERVQLAAEMAQAAETPSSPIRRVEENDPTIIDSQAKGESLQKWMENVSDTFVKDIHQGYKKAPVFAKILGNPTHYPRFVISDRLIWTTNRGGEDVLCIPSHGELDQALTGQIIDQAHRIMGHFG